MPIIFMYLYSMCKYFSHLCFFSPTKPKQKKMEKNKIDFSNPIIIINENGKEEKYYYYQMDSMYLIENP